MVIVAIILVALRYCYTPFNMFVCFASNTTLAETTVVFVDSLLWHANPQNRALFAFMALTC